MPPKVSTITNVIAHDGLVNSICVGDRTSMVYATGGADKVLNLWSLTSNTPRITFGPFASFFTSCKFNYLEDKILCGNNGGTVMLFELEDMKCESTWSAHRSAVNSVVFHPERENLLFSCGYDGKLSILSTSQRLPVNSFSLHKGSANCVSVSGDGRYAATCGDDKTVRIYDVVASKQIVKFSSHTERVKSVQFHPKYPILASSGEDRSVRFYDLETNKEIPVSFPLDTKPVDVIRFFPNEPILLSISSDNMRLFGWNPAEFYDQCPLGFDSVHDCSIVDDTIMIASSSKEKALIHKVKINTFKPFSLKSVKSLPSFEAQENPKVSRVPTPKLIDYSALSKAPDNEPEEDNIRQSSRGKIARAKSVESEDAPNTSEVYAYFRNDRAPFMSHMNERYSRFARLYHEIQSLGIIGAFEKCRQTNDCLEELLMLVNKKPSMLTLDLAVHVLEVTVVLFKNLPEVCVSTIEIVMEAFGKLAYATLQMQSKGVDVALDERKLKSELFVNAFKKAAPLLRSIGTGRSQVAKKAQELMNEWRALSK